MGQPQRQEGVGAMAGQEGICVVCRHLAHEHVRGGRWVGCKGVRGPAARLILVPDRRADSRAVTLQVDRRRDIERPVIHSVPQTGSVAYVALYPVSHERVQDISSDRDRGIYRLIARRKTGWTRADLLDALGTDRTGIVDGALRRLRLRNLVDRVEIDPS